MTEPAIGDAESSLSNNERPEKPVADVLLTEVVALTSNEDKTPETPEVILESADTHEDKTLEKDELTSSGEIAPKPADLIAPVKTEMVADETKLTPPESKSKRRRRRP